MVALGLWLGLAYGLAEATVVLLLGLIPGALAWRTGNSANILWFAPLFYGTVFLGLGALFAFGSRLLPRVRWDTGLVLVTVWLGGWLGLTVREGPLADWAAALLALGIAVELTRQYSRHRGVVARAAVRSLPLMAAAIPILAGLVVGAARLQERAAMAALPPAAAGRPNVLLLIIDTQRADHLSAYGYQRQTSPNLERFAAEGTLFLNAYSSSSWTLPSHASLMTGRPLHEHLAGVIRRPYLDGHYPTLAEAMRRAGYATGGVVANTFWTGRQTGLNRGFIHYEDFWGNLGDAVARTALGRRLAYGLLPRFGLIDIPGRKRAEEVNRDLLRWLDGLDQRRPFFAFVNYLDVHGPLLPPPPYDGRFSDGRAVHGEHEIQIGAIAGDIVVPPPAERRAIIDKYDESILYLDANLGRLFAELRRRGTLDNTVVVVTSDHGESWGEHGMMYHGHSLYYETLHVPLIVRYPARAAVGRRESSPVGVQQLSATIADLVGLGPSAFPGTSLFAPHAEAQPVLAEVARRSMVAANWPSSRGWLASVLTDRWQLIRRQTGEVELFDLQADPKQERNLAVQPGAASALVYLDSALSTLAPMSDGALMTRAARRLATSPARPGLTALSGRN